MSHGLKQPFRLGGLQLLLAVFKLHIDKPEFIIHLCGGDLIQFVFGIIIACKFNSCRVHRPAVGIILPIFMLTIRAYDIFVIPSLVRSVFIVELFKAIGTEQFFVSHFVFLDG